MAVKNIIGVDIGGTKCSVTLGSVDDAGRCDIAKKIEFMTAEQGGVHSAVAKLTRSAFGLLRESRNAGNGAVAVGICCGGPLDSKNGIILSPPNLPGWDDIHIKDIFVKEIGLPVHVQNDANAGALAEWKFGAARGSSNVVFLTYGTGMGAGLILDGRLYSGANDMAGEIGHVRLADFGPVGYGKAGSFEGFCSGGGIAQLARTMALEKMQMGEKVAFAASVEGLDVLTAKDVADLAAEGDPLAVEVFRVSGRYLGKALAILVDLINPEVIVLGTIYARSGGLLEAEMQAELARESLSRSRAACRVVPSELGEKLGDCAAIAVGAMQEGEDAK